VHGEKLAKEIVELLFGFRLKELKHHVGRLLLNNQPGGRNTTVNHIRKIKTLLRSYAVTFE